MLCNWKIDQRHSTFSQTRNWPNAHYRTMASMKIRGSLKCLHLISNLQ